MIDFSHTSYKTSKGVLLLSGGYDSSYTACELVRQNIDFYSIYVPLMNNDNKVLTEREAISKLQEYIKKKFNHELIVRFTPEFTIDTSISNIEYTQPYIWMTQTLLYLDVDVNYVLCGDLRHSDIWHVFDRLNDAFRNLWLVLHPSKRLSMDIPNIIPHFEWWEKHDVIESITSEYPELFDICVTCEDVGEDKIPCGKCNKCIEFETAKNIVNRPMETLDENIIKVSE